MANNMCLPATDGQSTPTTLYHYCDARAFMSMVRKKCVWLSHARYMNDYMEQEFFLEQLEERAGEFTDNQEYIERIRLGVANCRVPYVFCLSEVGDLLSQWRAYADDGVGFAIGFSREFTPYKLGENSGTSISPVAWQVRYSADDRRRAMRNCVGCYSYPADSSVGENVASTTLGLEAAVCKMEAFREEREWRIVLLPSPDDDTPGISAMQFRASRKGEVVPYYELSFDASAITHVCSGPKNPARGRHEDIKAFMSSERYDTERIDFVDSEASYQ